MTRRQEDRLRRALRRLQGQIGTPGFDAALTEFYAALAAVRPETRQ